MVRRGLKLAAVALVASNAVGCLATAERAHLLDELQRSRKSAVESQRHLAKLEERLAALEQARSPGPRDRDPSVLSRLEALVAENQRLLLQSSRYSAASQPAESDWPLKRAPAVCSTQELAPRERLRLIAEELRSDPDHWRGGLSPEQNAALYLLLRVERPLDRSNPWIYQPGRSAPKRQRH